MKISRLLFPLLSASALICLTAVSSFPPPAHGQSERLNVITTLFPLYDWVKTIGGDQVEARLLLPPGVESHSFDPSPRDVVRINQSDLFIYTGKYMEPWAEDLLKGVTNTELLAVDTSRHIELLDEGHQNELAYEWAGLFALSAGEHAWSMQQGPDPSMKVVILPASAASQDGLEALEDKAQSLYETQARPVASGQELVPGEILYELVLTDGSPAFTITIDTAGAYAFFTEHGPEEFHAQLATAAQSIEPVVTERAGGHGHGEDHGHHHHDGHHHDGHHHDGHHHDDHHHDGHHHHGGKDPHIWLEFGNAAKMIDNIVAGLSAKDPANSDLYKSRARQYQSELEKLDHRYAQALSHCHHRTIIYGGHFAFGYFAKRFDLEHVSPYKGFAPNADPTPRDIAELTDRIKSDGIKYIFYEEGIEPKIARVISEATGAQMLLLHGAHNVSKDELAAGVTYLSLMNDNLDRLQQGLECH